MDQTVHRREFLLGSAGAGIIAFGGCASTPAAESTRARLLSAVGRRGRAAGIVAVAVDRRDARISTYGSSGVDGLAMDGVTVFEIGSITKVLTAFLLADMASRGELSFADPVANYLPPSATIGVRGRPIRLIDLELHVGSARNAGQYAAGLAAQRESVGRLRA
jgi:CubicO group peptidase (beta-lactamase class C family)